MTMLRTLTARAALPAALAIAFQLTTPVRADEVSLRVSGLVSTHKYHVALEREFYGSLPAKTGLDLAINYNPLDVLGVNMKDTVRLVRTGTFDIVETTAGEAARDDPFLEGLDIIGVSPSFDTLRDTVEAYRKVFNERVEKRFNARVLSLWPYGPQVFYCKPQITGLASLKGMKVRSYTPTMSALLEAVGAVPVSLSFSEVYPALQRGVADCSITSPTSGNTGNWPEVTNYYFPLGISWSVNAHMMNLDKWNALTPDAQEKIASAFAELEGQFWQLARQNTGDANNCNVGAEPCEKYKKFAMKHVEPTEKDAEMLHKAVSSSILPTWLENCNASDPECEGVWRATVGKARGFASK